jgi:glutamate racemase
VLPAEEFLYAADSRFCPYGGRPPSEIRQRSLAIAGDLVAHGAKLLVVACNTASSVALDDLRAHLAIPVVGLEPAVKPAVALTRSGKIAVLATPRTAASERLARLIASHACGVEVRIVPAPGLVDLVEAGILGGPTVERALQPLLEPLVTAGVDTIVLGCTHYPFLRNAIASLLGPEVRLVDSGEAVARRTHHLLNEAGALAVKRSGSLTLLTTGEPASVAETASLLLGATISAGKLPLGIAA